jgi:hypothetical protein
MIFSALKKMYIAVVKYISIIIETQSNPEAITVLKFIGRVEIGKRIRKLRMIKIPAYVIVLIRCLFSAYNPQNSNPKPREGYQTVLK